MIDGIFDVAEPDEGARQRILFRRYAQYRPGTIDRCLGGRTGPVIDTGVWPGTVKSVRGVEVSTQRPVGWARSGHFFRGLFLPFFAPLFPYAGPLAQLAEQRTFNPRVPGSTPGRPTP